MIKFDSNKSEQVFWLVGAKELELIGDDDFSRILKTWLDSEEHILNIIQRDVDLRLDMKSQVEIKQLPWLLREALVNWQAEVESIKSMGYSEISASGQPVKPISLTKVRFVETNRKIGAGGFGEIVEVEDHHVGGRTVALKKIRNRSDDSFDDEVRFLEYESELTGLLEHPGIPAVYGRQRTSEGYNALAMQRLVGRSLDQENNTFDVLDFFGGHFLRILDTLEFAHANGVIHGDIKMSNLFVGEFGDTFVLDWAGAKFSIDSLNLYRKADAKSASKGRANEKRIDKLRKVAERSQPKQHLFSKGFSAPEIDNDGAIVDYRADIYSLGAVLEFMLFGKLNVNIEESGTSLSEQVRPLTAVVKRAKSFRPEDRYQTVLELKRDVKRVLAYKPISGHKQTISRSFKNPESRWYSIRKIGWLVLIAVSAVAMAGFFSWNLEQNRKARLARGASALISSNLIRNSLAENAEVISVDHQLANLNDQRKYLTECGASEQNLVEIDLSIHITKAISEMSNDDIDSARKTIAAAQELINRIDEDTVVGKAYAFRLHYAKSRMLEYSAKNEASLGEVERSLRCLEDLMQMEILPELDRKSVEKLAIQCKLTMALKCFFLNQTEKAEKLLKECTEANEELSFRDPLVALGRKNSASAMIAKFSLSARKFEKSRDASDLSEAFGYLSAFNRLRAPKDYFARNVDTLGNVLSSEQIISDFYFYSVGDLENAKRANERILFAAGNLRRQFPGSGHSDNGMIIAYMNLGSVFFAEGKIEIANGFYRNAMDIGVNYLDNREGDQRSEMDIEIMTRAIHAGNLIATSAMFLGNLDESLDLYRSTPFMDDPFIKRVLITGEILQYEELRKRISQNVSNMLLCERVKKLVAESADPANFSDECLRLTYVARNGNQEKLMQYAAKLLANAKELGKAYELEATLALGKAILANELRKDSSVQVRNSLEELAHKRLKELVLDKQFNHGELKSKFGYTALKGAFDADSESTK